MAVRSGQPHAWTRLLSLSLAVGMAAACARQPVNTGPAAAGAFLFQGSPVHPFCVDFPQESSSRKEPMDLATCTDRSATPHPVRDTWLAADRPPVDNAGGGAVEYRVLASAGDRFLLAVESSGGGSGSFSELFWVRLTDRTIGIERDELAGDRCAGGMSGYTVVGDTLRFYATASTRKLLTFANVSLSDTLLRRLRNQYYACDGALNYVYDLRSQRMTIESFTLDEPAQRIQSDGTSNIQKCFDALVSDYIGRRRSKLTPQEFRQFGAAFADRCAR